MNSVSLLELARTWAGVDPDPDTRTELEALIDSADVDALDLLFARPLGFGTAGIRGPLGPGPARFNRVVVRRTSAALGRFLLSRTSSPVVVVGFDARHKSEVFARDAASTLAALGCRVTLLRGPNPTPLLAFAVGRLAADAGVQITASHNPAADNGLKVYLGGDGLNAQIVSPVDGIIADLIESGGLAAATLAGSTDWSLADTSVEEEYHARVLSLLPSGPRSLKVVCTPVHGVGGRHLRELFARAGFTDVRMVSEQFEPDPSFPTAPKPNPEETGVLDPAFRLAAEYKADLVLALDPDADRLAVGVPDESGWRRLSGDDVAMIFAEFMLSRGLLPPGVLASSCVSSSLFPLLAAHHDRRHEFTATGFKWISRVPGLVFGYEEALGYCLDPSVVRDKDGISASLVMAGIAAVLKDEGRSLTSMLEQVHARHGVYVNLQRTVPVDPSASAALLDRGAASPPVLAGFRVLSVLDQRLLEVPSQVVVLAVADGERSGTLTLRPSGTEPKLKLYLELVHPTHRDLSGVDDLFAAVLTLLG